MLGKRIPLYYLGLSTILGGAITYVAITANAKYSQDTDDSTVVTTSKKGPDCNYGQVRLPGYKYVDPLLYGEKECESEWLAPMKDSINNYIQSEIKINGVTNASVYIKVFSNEDWTAISPDTKYHPASLLKLPVLLTFARMAESNPRLLDEKVFFEKHDASLPKPLFVSKTLAPGKAYTIKELLRYLIAYSDNDALYLLYNYHSPEVYKHVFSDLGIPMPELQRESSNITVGQYSTFLKVLYNGTYLTKASSEFALSYLAESDFKDGLLKGLPPETKVAHKFGEYYYGNIFELHESAIVYVNNKDYLITVMTRGYSMTELSNVLGKISGMAYNYIANGNSVAKL